MSDGNLRALFQQHLPQFHWQSVETWSTGQGVPDLNYCGSGCEGWIENKVTATWRVEISPQQVGWIERRVRAGGKVFIAVRRKHSGGIRKGKAEDELWLFSGDAARYLLKGPLRDVPFNFLLLRGSGGPSGWPWLKMAQNLLRL